METQTNLDMKPISMLIVLGTILSLNACESGCNTSDCADYFYQQEAQAAFDKNRKCHRELDHDSDGIACEHLPPAPAPSPAGNTGSNNANTGGNGCPTTANCGCSNKRKAECPSKCCKWVVGTGCKCK